jgi:hypothetical protein
MDEMKNGRKLVAVTMMMGMLGLGNQVMRAPQTCRFLHAYQSVKQINAPLRLWERVVVSYALASAGTRS